MQSSSDSDSSNSSTVKSDAALKLASTPTQVAAAPTPTVVTHESAPEAGGWDFSDEDDADRENQHGDDDDDDNDNDNDSSSFAPKATTTRTPPPPTTPSAALSRVGTVLREALDDDAQLKLTHYTHQLRLWRQELDGMVKLLAFAEKIKSRRAVQLQREKSEPLPLGAVSELASKWRDMLARLGRCVARANKFKAKSDRIAAHVVDRRAVELALLRHDSLTRSAAAVLAERTADDAAAAAVNGKRGIGAVGSEAAAARPKLRLIRAAPGRGNEPRKPDLLDRLLPVLPGAQPSVAQFPPKTPPGDAPAVVSLPTYISSSAPPPAPTVVVVDEHADSASESIPWTQPTRAARKKLLRDRLRQAGLLPVSSTLAGALSHFPASAGNSAGNSVVGSPVDAT